MFYRAAGPIYLAALDEDFIPGPYKLNICTDSIAVSLAVTSGTHQNKCGRIPVEDDRYIKSLSGTIDLSFADVKDANFALASLGTVVPGATGTVTTEVLPSNMEEGDVYFLGSLDRHRGITGLVLGSLVANTDYKLNAVSGMVTALVDFPSGDINAAYGYTDPQSVAMLNAGQKGYALMQENTNNATGNPGSLELYRAIFDPAQSMDFQSEDDQEMQIKGSVLANLSKPVDDVFGQFGRRVV